MTPAKIDKEKGRALVKFELATKIRESLDAARKEYGPTDWDNDDMEAEIERLIFESE